MSSCMAEPSLTSKKKLSVGVYRCTVYDFGFDFSGGLKLKRKRFFSLLDPPTGCCC